MTSYSTMPEPGMVGPFNGNMQNSYGVNSYGPTTQQSQQQQNQLQQSQYQQPQLQPPPQLQHQQQGPGVNPFTNYNYTPQPVAALVTPSTQTSIIPTPEPQNVNQWSVQPTQQQTFVQQPGQHFNGYNVGPHQVPPVPPFDQNTPQISNKASFKQEQAFGQAQNGAPVVQQAQQAQQPSYLNTQAYVSNPVQSQQQSQPPNLSEELDDFFGEFATRSTSASTETNRPASIIQTSGNEIDNVSVLSKATTASKPKKISPLDDPTFAPRPPRIEGLDNAKLLARNVPGGEAVLPDFKKVTHSGYILARISFRTIVVKKWKQVFWVTYGASKMLFFRSHADFEDWASNPYLTKNQRDFLVKLEVDFVEDAYQVNVRGYQVTSIRCKNYQSQMLNQFKLERWMDYGPTIAAAFASPVEKDVSTLRVIISEILKRCPQDKQLATHAQNAANSHYGIPRVRTYETPNYNEQPNREYISGSASTGAISATGSTRSARTNKSLGVFSTGAMDRMRQSIRDTVGKVKGAN